MKQTCMSQYMKASMNKTKDEMYKEMSDGMSKMNVKSKSRSIKR